MTSSTPQITEKTRPKRIMPTKVHRVSVKHLNSQTRVIPGETLSAEPQISEPPPKKVVITDPPTVQSQPVKLLPQRPVRPKKTGSVLLEPAKKAQTTSDDAKIFIRFKIKPPTPPMPEASAPAPEISVAASKVSVPAPEVSVGEKSADVKKSVVIETRRSKRKKGAAVPPA
ncbi:hypothetical protein MJO28_009814 [Puccinia striiformis f. sp. tritici]|uniref:Uncharacterized protein n=4 Tax=Puccinia striiformis TaxID=27350 RepID=A0A0L0VNN5_9BASI|nr:hypothetical protein Pst134EA_017346 [Puccinia striiformis f. sp. tritici]KNF00625.1 hypothetical protein PSTG_06040 [Puccinia striiformis f. sp. tritici PST-78]POW07988.1 hypothetical protein PSTT_07884 [Puccinia striiformis]KAH9450742.1 hypothetical protein Pst134EB_018262 [Puccinia striiformis f. sp. tritici]KAH9461037.1 hypothetical protein Pst134EA_017346 [Puccinia striiformis f. sp. tritici]KAI7947906.1 hypothetical protein MJO28_009814 [Puccinia striiformis f. sp. tritici]